MVYIGSARKEAIVGAIRAMYTHVARSPDASYPFPIGHAACTFVGYPAKHLADLPSSAVESFVGVAYPFAANVIHAGDTVLDIGAGSGTDLLLAAKAVGPDGEAIGLDITAAMIAKLATIVDKSGTRNVRLLEGSAEQIPLSNASIDVVTSNGVLNLVPDKQEAFAEIGRVLKPGGRLQLGDIALGKPLTGDCVANPRLWAECIVGATLEEDYRALLESAGLERIETVGHLEYFCASASAETRSIARSFNACSIVLRAVKPPAPYLQPPSKWPITPRSSLEVSAVSSGDAPTPDAVLDGYGQLCGTLEPAMRAAMRELGSGQVLEVRADDPVSRLGVPAWSRLAGHTLLRTLEEDNRRTRFFLRKR